MNLAQIVVIDGRPSAINEQPARLRRHRGDATRRDILRRAEIVKAREVIITLDRDDSAILVMLTVRQLNPSAHVVVAVREDDNASLLRQSGANAVVTSSEAVGRLLGLSAVSPNLGVVIEDLLLSSKELGGGGARGDPGRGGHVAARDHRGPGDRGGAQQDAAPVLRSDRGAARAG